MNQAELLCMENGKEAVLNERDSTVNCAKFSLAFFAQLETENVIFFSLPFATLVTQPTLVAAATKEAFTCPKNSPKNQRLKSPVMLRAASPPPSPQPSHSELLTPICFQEFHLSRGWSLQGRSAAVKAISIMSSLWVFCVPIPFCMERMFPRQTCMWNSHPFCISSAESARCFSACQANLWRCSPSDLFSSHVPLINFILLRTVPCPKSFLRGFHLSGLFILEGSLPSPLQESTRPICEGTDYHTGHKPGHMLWFVMCGSRPQRYSFWPGSQEETTQKKHFVFAHWDFLKNQTAFPVKH